VIIMFLSCTVFLNLTDGVCSFSSLKQPREQDTSWPYSRMTISRFIRLRLCKNGWDWSMKNHFHTWIGSSGFLNSFSGFLNSFKVFGMCWRGLYSDNTRSWLSMHLLIETTLQHLFPSRGA